MASHISDISLRDIEVFVMASRMQSLREVARQLDLLPAHISKIVQGLERKLDIKLFRRSVTGIILTPEGLAALKIAEQLYEKSHELAPGLSSFAEAPESVWTFGSIGFLATYLLPAVACELKDKGKRQLRFRFIEFTHNDLVAHGLKGAFEMALHIGELQWTHVWESYPIGTLTWKLYGCTGHPLGSHCKEADVLKYPFVVPTDWGSHGYELGEDFCPLSVRRRKKGHEAATAETALEICRHTQQLTFVPEIVAQNWRANDSVREIEVEQWPVQTKPIFLSVKTDVMARSLVETLRKKLTQTLASR